MLAAYSWAWLILGKDTAQKINQFLFRYKSKASHSFLVLNSCIINVITIPLKDLSYILCFSPCFSPFTLFLTRVHFIFSMPPSPSCRFSFSLNLKEEHWYVGCHTTVISHFFSLNVLHKKESWVFQLHIIFKHYKGIILVRLSMQVIGFFFLFSHCMYIWEGS